MRIIVCADENNGMMFNHRRQSRDRVLIEDVVELTAEHRLWMNEYSAPLFDRAEGHVVVDEKFLSKASDEEFCFVEDQSVASYSEKIKEVILYRWNRKYPADVYFDLDLMRWKMTGKKEFAGSSHEKITRERYIKGE